MLGKKDFKNNPFSQPHMRMIHNNAKELSIQFHLFNNHLNDLPWLGMHSECHLFHIVALLQELPSLFIPGQTPN